MGRLTKVLDRLDGKLPPQRRRTLRVALVLLVLLVGLGCAASWLRSESAAEALRRLVIVQGSRALGEDLFVQRLRVDALFPPALTAHGITVHSADAERLGQPLLRVERLSLALGGGMDLRGRVVPIEDVSLVRPALRFAMGSNGPRDFRALLPDPRRSKPERPVRIHLGALEVGGGGARLTFEPPGVGTAIAGVDLRFRQDKDGAGLGTLGVRDIELIFGELRERAVLKPGTFTLDGSLITLAGYQLDLRTGPIRLDGEVQLPAAPGIEGQPRPVGYALSADADIALPLLHDAWPKIPVMEGRTHVALQVTGTGPKPQVAFDLQGDSIVVHVSKPKPKIFRGGNPSLRGYYFGDMIKLTHSSIEWGGGMVSIDGEADLSREITFAVDVGFHDLHLEEVLDSVTVPGSWVQMGMTGSARLSGGLAGGFHATGDAEVAVTEFILQSGPWDGPGPYKELLRVPRAQIRAGLTLDGSHCLLSPATVTGPGSNLNVTADFLFRRPLGLVIRVGSTRFDMGDLENKIVGLDVHGHGGLEAWIEGPTKDLDIHGTFELEDLVFNRWPFGQVEGEMRWHSRQDLEFTRLRARRGMTDFASEVRVLFADIRRGGDREQLEINVEVDVPEGHGRAEDLLPIFFGDAIDLRGPAYGRATLHGRPGALNGSGWARAGPVRYLWEDFGSLDVDIALRNGDLFFEQGWARKASGDALFARGVIERDRGVEVEFRLPDMAVQDLAPLRDSGLPLRGRISGHAVLSGDLGNVGLSGRLDLIDASYDGSPLADSSVSLMIRDHQLVADGVLLGGAVQGAASLRLEGLWPYDFSLDSRGLSLDSFIPPSVFTRDASVTAGLVGRLNGEGTLRDRWHDLRLELDELFFERSGRRIAAAPDRPLLIAYRDGAIKFEQVRLKGPVGKTDLTVEGGIWLDGPLDVQIRGAAEISFLDLVTDTFDRAEAQEVLVDLDFKGRSMSAVDIEGTLDMREGLLKTSYFPHAVEVEHARIRLLDRLVTLEQFDGARLGGGELVAAGSWIRLDRSGYRPREYGLRMKCTDCTLKYPSFMPPIRGTVRLAFDGLAPEDLLLSGTVSVTEMTLRDPLNWQRAITTIDQSLTENLAPSEEPPLFDFDININSLPEVIRIANNVGDIHGTARNVRVSGDTNTVRLGGRVDVDGGSFRFRGRNWKVEPGTADFGGGESWYPDLHVSMWDDIEGRLQSYRIVITATGPLNNPDVKNSSEPQLAEKDINSLLLFGLTEEELSRASLAELAGAAGGALASSFTESAYTSFADSRVKEEGRVTIDDLLPDRVEVVPVYTDTTGSTTLWVVASKELVDDLLYGEFGAGYGRDGAVIRAEMKVRLLKNVYLEGSWRSDETTEQAYGNFGLDLNLELNFD